MENVSISSINPEDPATTSPIELWKIFVLIVPLSLLIIVIILGNALVVVTVYLEKTLQTVPNILITSLAIADLLVGILVLPLGIVYLVHGGKWSFGDVICHFWLTADVTLCTVSILHLCVIGIDRYRTIIQGISYIQQRSLQGAFGSIIVIWTVALWIASPSVLGWNDFESHKDSSECLLNSEEGYVLHSALGSLIFPLILLMIIYYQIYAELQKRFMERNKIEALEASNCEDETMSEVTTLPRNPNKLKGTQPPRSDTIKKILQDRKRFSLTRERKAAKVLGIIVGTFLLCWLPFGFIYILTPFLSDNYKPNFTIFQITTWLGYLNSGINPWIYSGFSSEFRNGFKKILRMQTQST